MKKMIAVGILSCLVIGMIFMSGCTSSQSRAPVYTPAITAAPTSSIPKEIVVSNGDYTAHGLRLQANLAENGDKITYKDTSGNPAYLNSQTGKQLLKFDSTITSIDGETGFYILDFFLMDDNGISYNQICPWDSNHNCKNQDGLQSMSRPITGQKTAGIMIFQIPQNINHVYLIYKFSTYSDNPQIIKFDQVLKP